MYTCMCYRFYLEWKDRGEVMTENGNHLYETNSVQVSELVV